MAFLKSKWRLIVLVVVCLGSVAGGAWAYMAGDEIDQKLQQIDRLRGDVQRAAGSAANRRTIEARKKDIEERNAALDQTMSLALSTQKFNPFYEKADSSGKTIPSPRQPLVANALPQPTSNGVAIDFKDAYVRAFDETKARLRARDKPTNAEIQEAEKIASQISGKSKDEDAGPWNPGGGTDKAKADTKNRSLPELLKEYPRSQLAERTARDIYMYYTEGALGRHRLAISEAAPKPVEIWQAQMSLWIQQDIVAALARVNEQRAAQLLKDNKRDEIWVANMPVKHLLAVRIADRLGNGGGSNILGKDWPVPTFTGMENNDKMFVVPIQIDMIVEEAQLNRIIDSLCKVGFYTPTSVSLFAVEPNPAQDDYVYGDVPIIRVVLDLEGYFFRKVYEDWIPKDLKETLKKKDPSESQQGRDRGEGG